MSRKAKDQREHVGTGAEASAPAASPIPDKGYNIRWDGMTLLRPIPHRLDSTLAALCRRYADGDEAQRAALRASISMAHFYTLLAFAHRAAVFALREQSAAWVIDGLTAVTMIDVKRIDYRDVLVALGLLYHAATRVGLDGDQLFRDVGSLAEPGTARLVRGLARRTSGDKRLGAWGFEEVETAEGIGLIQGGFRGTKPRYDLIALTADLAGYFAKDRYTRPDTEFGTMMPRVWLEGRNNAALERALRSFRTGASLEMAMKRLKGVQASAQYFVVFLMEMKTDVAARELLRIARKKKPRFFCKVELAVGRLFCLIVARSWVHGVDPVETPESLARFADPVAAILRRHVTE